MAASVEKYSIYHDKELGLYSEFTPVHHNVVELALPIVMDAIGKYRNRYRATISKRKEF